jgi:hypothetical protein
VKEALLQTLVKHRTIQNSSWNLPVAGTTKLMHTIGLLPIDIDTKNTNMQ